MYTILLEVKSNDPQRRTNNFYNPAPADFKRFPRTSNGIEKALDELNKLARESEWVEDWRYVVYEGKYHYSKQDMKPMFVMNSDGEAV